MKKRILFTLLALVLACSLSLVTAVPVAAADPTTIESSTMVFESVPGFTLTYDSGTQTYSGMIPMVETEPEGLGDGLPGYDLFARNGATYRVFTGTLEEGTISQHDWTTWNPDTPDWDGYSLRFYNDGGVQKWRVANHSGTGGIPWYAPAGSGEVEQGVPMSGEMDWTAMYATETDAGEYLSPIDPDTHPSHPRWAAANGGGPACWDMDWSWGSEVVPLAFPGFAVAITDLGEGDYQVTLTPAAGDNPPGPVVNENTGESYGTIQSAIDSAAPTPPPGPYPAISVAAGTYDLTSPIVVHESVTITGDIATPSNVVVNAPTTAGLYDRDCFQVIANDVTIQGFRIVGAQDWREGDVGSGWTEPGRQNAGIMVGSEATLTSLEPNVYQGISGGTFSYNEFVDCSKGLFLYHATNCEVSYNTITTTEGEEPDNFYDTMAWNGDGVHVYLEVPSYYPTGNTISHNTMDNVRVGIFLNGDTLKAEQPSAWDFRGTTIEDNTMTNVWNAGIVLQCASGTAESPITISLNDIDTSTGRRVGDEGNERGLISVKGDYTVITGNSLTNSEEHGLWVDGSHHTVTVNTITSNTKDGIHVGWYKETEPVNGWTLPEITRADITISTNTLENVGAAAAILAQGGESIAILDNTITDFTKGGIVVKDIVSVQIELNTISTTDHSAAPNGIQIGYLIDETATTGTVKDNQVSGCLWEGYDPLTETYEDDWTGSGILVIAPNSALEISGNEVQSCDVALDIEAGSGTLITSNDVHDNSYGFVLWNAAPTISFNNIYQNALCGVYRTTEGLEGTLDATNNWWDSASGPTHASNTSGTGDPVTDYVVFSPWLGATIDTTPMTFIVDDVGPEPAAGYIQEAIDNASSGDTVNVAAGTYTESVLIGKPLTLRGPNAVISPVTGSTRVAEAVITGSAPLVELESGADVNPLTIEGFTFQEATHPGGSRGGVIFADGESDGWGNVTIRSNRFINNYGPAIGVWASGPVNSAGWTITDNLIDKVTGTDRSGIYLDMDLAPYTLTGWEISNNTIRNTEYGGIMVDDAVDMVISGNTIEDVQKTGIQSSGVSQNVTITDNVITRANLAYEESPRAGIRLYGWYEGDEYSAGTLVGPVSVTNNIVTDSYIGFEIKEGHHITGKVVHVNGNSFTGNSQAGLRHGGAGLLDATNNWWGNAIESQIAKLVSGNVDYSPWLDAADGKSTSLDVTTISLASGWNLISLPLIPDDSAIETVLAGVTVNKVAYYTGGPEGSWLYYTGDLATSDLTQMQDGKGYWIDVSTAGALTIRGYELCAPPPAVPPSYNLVEGWNLISFKSLATNTDVATYLGTAVTDAIEAMYGYDAAAGLYTIIKSTDPLVPGDGYWLAVSAEGTIYP